MMNEDDFKKAIQEALEQATVKVCTSTGFKGTGFFITPDGYILTAWHCIEKEASIVSLSSSPVTISSITIKSDYYGKEFPKAQLDKEKSNIDMDIAVIKVDYSPKRYVPLGLIEKKHRNDEIISLGYPAGYIEGRDKIGVYSGEISRLFNDDNTVEVSGSIQGEGHSGGLVYHYHTHRVIGMVTELYKKNTMPNAGCAVKFDFLLRGLGFETNDEVAKDWDDHLKQIEQQRVSNIIPVNTRYELPLQDYEYDVFLSYRDYGISGKWVLECFKPLLEHCLEDALGERPQIFYAKQENETILPPYSEKLAYSRCLIPMWSPAYLELPWSFYECSTFKQRTPANHHKFIFPVVICDGHKFDKYEFTHNISNRFDCRNYIYRPEVFNQSPKQMDLHDKIREWVEEVVKAIESVSSWKPQWIEEASMIAKDFKHEEPKKEFLLPKIIKRDE